MVGSKFAYARILDISFIVSYASHSLCATNPPIIVNIPPRIHNRKARISQRFSITSSITRKYTKTSSATKPTVTTLHIDTADVSPKYCVLTVTVSDPHRENNDQSISVAAAYVAITEKGIGRMVKNTPTLSGQNTMFTTQLTINMMVASNKSCVPLVKSNSGMILAS